MTTDDFDRLCSVDEVAKIIGINAEALHVYSCSSLQYFPKQRAFFDPSSVTTMLEEAKNSSALVVAPMLVVKGLFTTRKAE